jgi:ATP-dependent Zn protease
MSTTTNSYDSAIASKIIKAGTLQGFTDAELEHYINYRISIAIANHDAEIKANDVATRIENALAASTQSVIDSSVMIQLNRANKPALKVVESD